MGKVCIVCKADISRRDVRATLFFGCLYGWGKRTGARHAASCVQRAVSQGLLKKVRECVCVDCGRGATAYDHRDYNRPLDVAPVCHSCNKLRGPAIHRPAATETVAGEV